MSNTKQFLENILKESDEVPYCDDVNCEPVKEEESKKINENEFYTDEAEEIYELVQNNMTNEERKNIYKKINKEEIESMSAFWDWFEGLDSDEIVEYFGYLKEEDNLKEADESEEQPQEGVQTEEPVNDFERLSPEVQEILNDMSNDNAMYKWVIDDVMDSDISGYNGDTFDEKLKSRLEEITEHGCQSGTVSSLIYYTDTVKFFDNFNDEIYDMVEDVFGAESTLEMLQRHCELIDIIMGADTVKNYLAWMAYEVTCSNILDSMESA